MGLFGDLWDGLKKGVKKVAGLGVEFFGNLTGFEKIAKFGRELQGEVSEKVAAEKSYDKREANINTTERLNEILLSFSEGYLQQAVLIEKQCIRMVEGYYDSLIKTIEDSSKDGENAANLRALKSGRSRIAKDITGEIKKPLSKRMSLDDSECLRILKMEAGSKKKQAMTNFTGKVMREALENLSRQVSISLTDQTEMVEEYFTNIVDEYEKNVRDTKSQLDNMIRNIESEQNDMEMHCVTPLYLTELSERVTDILK